MSISCQQYDFVEIACMYKYSLKITLKSGEQIEGTAIDTTKNIQKEECIKLSSGLVDTLIVLEDIHSIRTTTENPFFNEIVTEK